MSRYIDANELLGKLPYPADEEEAEFYGKVLDAIDSQPTVDAVEVVHGEWKRHGYKWRCSKCDEKINIDGTPYENGLYYCHNCGAKMDGKKVE